MTTTSEQFLSHDPRSNSELLWVFLFAADAANTSKTVVGDPHMLDALLRIASVSESLAAIGVDVPRAREGVKQVIAKLPRVGWGERFVTVSRRWRDLVDPLGQARAAARAAGLGEVTGPFAFACIAARPENHELHGVLAQAGFSLLAYRWRIAHGDLSDAPMPSTSPVRVTLHNDPFTPFAFVIDILTGVFERDRSVAEAITRRVHEDGSAILATMDAEVAARSVAELRRRANAAQWPLRASVVAADRT